jgi:uncharacterized RDD family membrane protein YckC
MNENPASTSNPYATPQADLSVQRAPHEVELAGRMERLGAAIIDGLIMMVVSLGPIIAFFGGWTAYSSAVQSGGYMMTVGGTVFGFVMYLLVNGYFLSKTSQSIGKKLTGIKIVRTDGATADFLRIVTRRLMPVYALNFVPVVGPFLGIVEALFIFRKSKKCLHDDVADTVVIRI